MSDTQSIALANARKECSEDITHRVENAIRLLLEQGKRPSFYSVSNLAQVARSTLYRREDLKRLVVTARETMSSACSSGALGVSLQDLKQENEQLRRAMENLAERYLRLQLENLRLRKAIEDKFDWHVVEQASDSKNKRVSYYFVSLDSRDVA